MILCLDIGNSHVFGGIFDANNELLIRFRHPTYNNITPNQIGVFLKDVLRQNNIDFNQIESIALCSVVPWIDHSLKTACKKHFKINPFFLNSETNTSIKINIDTPSENGADIIAGTIAASHFYPNKDILIVDLGTVTTIAAMGKNREYLGAAFIPGIRTAMNSLKTEAAKLPPVEIMKTKRTTGKNTIESIQSGLFWGHLGAIKEITSKMAAENFKSKPLIIATGGLAPVFKEEKIFSHIEPDLVLHGIKMAYDSNKKNK